MKLSEKIEIELTPDEVNKAIQNYLMAEHNLDVTVLAVAGRGYPKAHFDVQAKRTVFMPASEHDKESENKDIVCPPKPTL